MGGCNSCLLYPTLTDVRHYISARKYSHSTVSHWKGVIFRLLRWEVCRGSLAVRSRLWGNGLCNNIREGFTVQIFILNHFYLILHKHICLIFGNFCSSYERWQEKSQPKCAAHSIRYWSVYVTINRSFCKVLTDFVATNRDPVRNTDKYILNSAPECVILTRHCSYGCSKPYFNSAEFIC